MLAPPTFPEWLPPAVTREAQRILDTRIADAALVLRLATDTRMQTVWRVLSEHAPEARPQLSEWATLMKGRADVDPPHDADALAMFFWSAYTIAWLEAAAGTASVHNLPMARYQRLAEHMRVAAYMLRKLTLQHGRQVESQNQFANIHASQIEDAAEFCDEIVQVFKKFKAAEAPLVVDRNQGNQEARGYVRMLTVEARKLFGRPALYSTLARVASVALMKDVTLVQVRKWGDSLD